MRIFYSCLLLTGLLIGKGHCDQAWEQLQSETVQVLPEIPGWCRPEKALDLMTLIYETNPKICVEIGVFGGSSIYPTAQAVKFLGNEGVVYAIDPWLNSDCTEGYAPGNANYGWWNSIDLDQIYNGFVHMLNKHQLRSHCRVLRMTSEQALDLFADDSIDILHIDGNHSDESALRDAMLYLPKVAHGGYIWFDDINWSSTEGAIAYLSKHCMASQPVILDLPGGLVAYQLFMKR